jgi:hypothetical protein
MLIQGEHIMKIFNPYEHLDGHFNPAKIKIIYTPTDYAVMPKATVAFASLQAHLPPEEITMRETEWEKAIAKEPLENEPLVSVRFVDMETGNLKVAPAQYKDWKTMAKKVFIMRLVICIFLMS